MNRPVSLLPAVAGLCAAALLVLGVGAVRSARSELALAAIWEDVEASRWQAVLERSEPLLEQVGVRARAAEMRCWALLAEQRRSECAALLDSVLDERAERSGWLPDPMLTRLAIAHRRDAGHLEAAAALARRATHAHPADVVLRQLELATRSAIGDEVQVLAEFEQSLVVDDADTLALRIALASRHRRRADWSAVLRVLGDAPPPSGHPLLDAWFDERLSALAALGRLEPVRAAFAEWRARGGDPVELEARYALRLSVSQLPDPERSWTGLLQDALARGDGIRDARLRAQLYERLVAHLLVDGHHGRALEAYDEALAAGIGLPGITREQLERGAALESAEPGSRSAARLVFRIPEVLRGGTLAVSNVEAEPDARFEQHALDAPARGGAIEVVLERRVAAWPERWVVRDAAGALRGSGSVWPRAGEAAEVSVAVRPAPAPGPEQASSQVAARTPGDARRRVFAIVLDCGDWRLVQYLRERRELPVLEALFGRGHRAVLTSEPPLTAAAMESLVWPERGSPASLIGVVHELGVELAGLASVGRNPFGFLDALLPEGESLFEVIGEGPLVAANMLFTHGLIDAGRHAEMVGPHGRRRVVETARAQRPLRPEELAADPDLSAHPEARGHLTSIAAQLDAALELARAGETDLLVLRVEALDILTHALFSELAASRQDDGHSTLLAAYRYLDTRIGELDAALDGDDVLIVLSDHGIRSAMEHERDALFVAVAGDIARGRAEGRPNLRGVPKVLAGLLGVATPWPDTGIADLARPPALAAAEPDAERPPPLAHEPVDENGSPGRI